MKKVLLINGSPNAEGCVFTALTEVAGELNKCGVETSIFHIGNKPVYGCMGCGHCWKSGVCIFGKDVCNEMAALMKKADGIIVGSPVYYAGPNGALCALLDRAFYSASADFAYKPAAAVLSCRRGGASAAFDRLNKYFTINRMPVVSSQYWNAVHGSKPEDVKKDLEGLQIMRTLGRNMAWMLENIEKGKVELPERELGVRTDFISE